MATVELPPVAEILIVDNPGVSVISMPAPSKNLISGLRLVLLESTAVESVPAETNKSPSLLMLPSTSVAVIVYPAPVLVTTAMPAPLMANEPPPPDKVVVLADVERTCADPETDV